jgi:autotransporter-associated beta strand protein
MLKRSVLRGAVASTVAVILSSWQPAFAQFASKLTTPVLIQDGFGPAGNNLQYGGQEYCCPTAVAMSLGYLGQNGFNQIGPANPTTADGLNTERILSGLMNTDPLNGTAYVSNMTSAISTYLAAKGISTSNYTLTTTHAPTVSQLATLNQPGTVVDLVAGYYVLSSGSYVREGGHCIALDSQAINALNQSSPSTLVINNPYPGAFAPVSDVGGNSLEYLNTVATTGSQTADGSLILDHNQFPNFWGGTQTVVETAINLTVNPTQQSTNSPAVSTWNITSAQMMNTNGGSLSVLAPITGAGGLSIGTWGTVELQNNDNSTGANSISLGTLRSDDDGGVPVGSGSLSLNSATLQLIPTNIGGTIDLTGESGTGGAITFSGGSTIDLNRNGNSSLTYLFGGNSDGVTPDLVRSGTGTLVVAAASGTSNLGTVERISILGSNGNLPAIVNGMFPAYIVAQDNDANASGDFITSGNNGFTKAAYTDSLTTPITSATSTTVYHATTPQSVPPSGTAQVYAVVVGAVTISGGSRSNLNVGPQTSGQAGVILNGGTISTADLNFGPAEAVVYTSNAGGTISSAITGTGGLTSFGPGTLKLAGNNTYSGTTTVNSGILNAANIAGSATGTGPVNVQPNGTLEISGASAQAGATTTTINSGGTLLLNGGTLNGTLNMSSGSYLYGQGTVNGSATVSGTIGGSATNFGAAPFTGVENITFNSAVTMNGTTIYDWRLNALDANPADAGVNWSILKYTAPFSSSSQVDMGTSGNAIHFTLDLGSNVPDPNSGNPFWNTAHQWDAANATNGFYWIYYHYNFATYADGYFSLSTDSNFHNLYVNYTPTTDQWNLNGNGNWTATGDWSGYVPNSVNAAVTFGTNITSATTVTLDTPQTAGTLNFTSPQTYTLAGSNTLTLSSSAGPAVINVNSGNPVIAVPIALAGGLNINAAATTGITLAGAITGAGTLTANGPGTVLVAVNGSIGVPLVLNGPMTLASHGATGGILVRTIPSITLGTGGILTVANTGAGNGSNRTLVTTGALNLSGGTTAWTSSVDLTNNDVDVAGAALSVISNQIQQGYHNGYWNGPTGIYSGAAAGDTTHLTALGCMQNNQSGAALFTTSHLFDGITPAAGDVLVKYTYYGDANLSGNVDSSDYALIDNGYLSRGALAGWFNGDFNYDGAINGSDYTLIDNAFNLQGASLAASVATSSEIAPPPAGTTSVPEPTGLALGIILSSALLGRRLPDGLQKRHARARK